jgi:hypothetical protein
VPGQDLQLRLPRARSRYLRLRRELLLWQDLRLRQELMTNPSCGASRGTPQQSKEQTMKNLLQSFASLIARLRTPSIEEQYLAQAVDAHDLQVRLLALERVRP